MLISTSRRSVLILLVGALLLAGCQGKPAIDQNTRCDLFIKASAQDRNEAVSRLAVDLGVRHVLNPGLRGNVEMVCGEHPESTLGSVISSVGGKK